MNKNLSRAKKLIMIPLVILAITFVCLLLASILEIPAGRGFIYSVCALIGVMSIFLSPLPCLLMSLLGTIFAAKALKEGANINDIVAMPVREDIGRYKYTLEDNIEAQYNKVHDEITRELAGLIGKEED